MASYTNSYMTSTRWTITSNSVHNEHLNESSQHTYIYITSLPSLVNSPWFLDAPPRPRFPQLCSLRLPLVFTCTGCIWQPWTWTNMCRPGSVGPPTMQCRGMYRTKCCCKYTAHTNCIDMMLDLLSNNCLLDILASLCYRLFTLSGSRQLISQVVLGTLQWYLTNYYW